MTLLIDRSSVHPADDLESHVDSVEISPMETVESAILKVLVRPYLAQFSGGRGTWIVECGKPTPRVFCRIRTRAHSSIAEHTRALAVVAQQWDKPKYLVSPLALLSDFVDFQKGLFFMSWGQANPHLVFDCIQVGKLPDRYGAPKMADDIVFVESAPVADGQ